MTMLIKNKKQCKLQFCGLEPVQVAGATCQWDESGGMVFLRCRSLSPVWCVEL